MDVNLITFQEIVKDREAWRAAVHGITKSQTGLSSSNNLKTMFQYPKKVGERNRKSPQSQQYLPWKKPKLGGQDLATPVISEHTKAQLGASVKEWLSGLPASVYKEQH